ncbi:MAG TPA: aspartate aminotransferase family protein [Gemmatimonadales bacterium]|nr:aspartate aminotransferase family protein [Gemmatimonadales bacterium]
MSIEEELYRRKTPASFRFFTEARQYLPGGDSRSTVFYRPYPAVMDHGDGCLLHDVDGNRLLDFTGNHSSLIHGYSHPDVMSAVQHQLRKGTTFPGATEPQLRFARMLCERIPSVERIRFTSSGTEAVLNAIRAARAFTGRSRIAKVEGGYHGTADDVMVSIHPSSSDAGDRRRPKATPHGKGVHPDAASKAVVLPFNDVESAGEILQSLGDELAAVLVEPVLGSAGMIPAEQEYLEALRELTHRYGILLIFDEVVSFRVAYGGAQAHYGVVPDLTCLGKLIGGGFPLGAFGGRGDIMALFDPTHGPAIPHPGSHNANPVALAAGAACFEILSPRVVDQLNCRAETLRSDIANAFSEASIPVQVTGLGSLFGLHLTPRPVRSYRDTLSGDAGLRHRIFLGLYNEGILIDPRGVGSLTTALDGPEIARFGAALRKVLARVNSPSG